jgi:hypothetical protein
MPVEMPKLAGFSCAFGVVLDEKRLKPMRASLTMEGANVWLSFSAKICLSARVRLPNPGIVLPVRVGSFTFER